MLRFMQQLCLAIVALCWALPAYASVDSYRYLHVTIDTPWAIFIFIFCLVFVPMVLLIILHWWNAIKKDDDDA